MTEQQMRDRVVAGLEWIAKSFSGVEGKIAVEALELLEAQKPRVMALDEILDLTSGSVVWLEDFDKPNVIAGLLEKVFTATKVFDFLIVVNEGMIEVTADFEDYGRRWRCWDNKPTDEQRKATSWCG